MIEIQETDIAGEFVVWAMTAPTQLQRLNVVIPRILYVNVTAAGKGMVLKKLIVYCLSILLFVNLVRSLMMMNMMASKC